MSKVFGGVFGALLFVALLTVAFGSWYTIDQGERGVILRNGALAGVAEPGLGFKTPWIESVVDIPVTQQIVLWNCAVKDDGTPAEACPSDRSYEMMGYSADTQNAAIRVSVAYHVPPEKVAELYSQYTSIDNMKERLIAREVPRIVKTVFGHYNAATFAANRADFNVNAEKTVKDEVHGPVVIDSVNIENVDFSTEYEKSIEAKMLAEVDVQKVQQNAAKAKVTAQITVTEAQAQADSRLAQARAAAEATRIQGEAEADAIRARAAALGANPGLVELTKAERWDGKLPTTMLPSGAVPFLDAGAAR